MEALKLAVKAETAEEIHAAAEACRRNIQEVDVCDFALGVLEAKLSALRARETPAVRDALRIALEECILRQGSFSALNSPKQ
jgi:hypothetical protein